MQRGHSSAGSDHAVSTHSCSHCWWSRRGVPEAEHVLAITGVVVLVSVVAHGASATPLSAWYWVVGRARATDACGRAGKAPPPACLPRTPPTRHASPWQNSPRASPDPSRRWSWMYVPGRSTRTSPAKSLAVSACSLTGSKRGPPTHRGSAPSSPIVPDPTKRRAPVWRANWSR